MDSGTPPPRVFFSQKRIPSFGKGKVLGVALALSRAGSSLFFTLCWASSKSCF